MYCHLNLFLWHNDLIARSYSTCMSSSFKLTVCWWNVPLSMVSCTLSMCAVTCTRSHTWVMTMTSQSSVVRCHLRKETHFSLLRGCWRIWSWLTNWTAYRRSCTARLAYSNNISNIENRKWTLQSLYNNMGKNGEILHAGKWKRWKW